MKVNLIHAYVSSKNECRLNIRMAAGRRVNIAAAEYSTNTNGIARLALKVGMIDPTRSSVAVFGGEDIGANMLSLYP
jgi:hypothetical protein